MADRVRVLLLSATGLEPVVADEARELPSVAVDSVAYRRVLGTVDAADLASVRTLHCVDDAFVHLATWNDIGRPRAALARITGLTRLLDLREGQRVVGTVRPVPERPRFGVSASFVGKRNYRTDEIIAAFATGITEETGWPFTEHDPDADLSFRLLLDHDEALVGLRLARQPLRLRPWLTTHRLAGLRPPVAAAMVRLAGVGPGERVLDSCCGTGTIAIEAALAGGSVVASDIDPDAIAVVQERAALAGVSVAARIGDARHVPQPNASVDAVVTNPRWGRQAEVEDDAAAFAGALTAEIARLLRPGGRAVLLTTAPELYRHDLLAEERRLVVSVSGQRPTMLLLRRRSFDDDGAAP